MVEPLQADAGVRVPPDGYLAAVAASCERWGALLVVDERQTALRTGTVLACSSDGVTPDIVCMAHCLAGGFPLGVMAAKHGVARHLAGRGGWFVSADSANPIICAAAAATLVVATGVSVQAAAATTGEHLQARLRALRLPEIRAVRGRGLMAAVELHHGGHLVARELQQRGVLVIYDGNGIIRMLPPLTVTRQQVDTAAEQLASAIRAVRRKPRAPHGDSDAVTLPGVPAKRGSAALRHATDA